VGHIGLTPQSVHQPATGSRVKEAEERILAEAIALEQAGAFAVVLSIFQRRCCGLRKAKAIGIGPHCDGQVLSPQIYWSNGSAAVLKSYANLRDDCSQNFGVEVREHTFPEH